MNKRFIISEEEKKSILEMYEKRSFKNLLMEYDKSMDVLNEKGQYITQGDVILRGKFVGENGKETTTLIKKGSLIWADEDGIHFWDNDHVSGNSKQLIKVQCSASFDSVYGYRKEDGNWYADIAYTKVPNASVEPKDFYSKLKSMFCCGTKVKPYNKRPGSRAWAKPGEEGYTCGDDNKENTSTKLKVEIPNEEWCQLPNDKIYYYAKKEDGWYFTRKEPINWKKLDPTKYQSAITKLEDPTNGAKNIKTDNPCGK